MPQTIWILTLDSRSRRQLNGIRDLLAALPGRRLLLTDMCVHDTIEALERHGLLGMFHLILDRGTTRIADPAYLEGVPVPRKQRCVYIDTHADAVVRAKLLGWYACLIHGSAENSESSGSWYDARFRTVKDALYHFVFGTIRRRR